MVIAKQLLEVIYEQTTWAHWYAITTIGSGF